MIPAIKNNKTKLDRKEDMLTSSFFGLLFYMPEEVIEKFFQEITKIQDTGDFIKYEFWPHWNPDGTGNKNYIEPDLFVRFEQLDIIIEAKAKGEKQLIKQWTDEIISYKNEYGDENKKHILLGIGGILDFHINDFNNKFYTWFDAINILRRIIEKEKTDILQKIFNDILFMASMHGILTKEITWFEDFEAQTIDLSKSLTVFDNWVDYRYFPRFSSKYKINNSSKDVIEKWEI